MIYIFLCLSGCTRHAQFFGRKLIQLTNEYGEVIYFHCLSAIKAQNLYAYSHWNTALHYHIKGNEKPYQCEVIESFLDYTNAWNDVLTSLIVKANEIYDWALFKQMV